MSSRNFCFTLNNYTEEEEALLQNFDWKYIVYGHEIAPTTLTPHLQGFFKLQRDQKLTIRKCQEFLQNTVGVSRMSIQIARGSTSQNKAYCTKGTNIFEKGIPDEQGKRSDLQDVVDKIKSNAPLNEIIEDCTEQFIKFNGGILKTIALCAPPRTTKPLVYWLYGTTGSGKSRWAWENFPNAYSKDPSNKWWDGYYGQEVVIIDDFRPSKELPFNQLLRLLDRYPLTVEIKGASIQFNAKCIIITTPKNPTQTFERLEWVMEEQINQLLRRIDCTFEFIKGNPFRPAVCNANFEFEIN